MGKTEAGKQVTCARSHLRSVSLPLLSQICIPHTEPKQKNKRGNKANFYKHGSCPKVVCSITSIQQQNI